MGNIQKKFGYIYDKYVKKVYLFVYLKVSSPEIAEDITSRVFLQSWNKFKEVKDLENPRAYIYRVARNEVINYYREKSKLKIVSTESIEISGPEPEIEEKTQARLEIQDIKKAVSLLKDDYQNIVIWHYLDDLPIKEIAGIMEKPEGTVRVMLHRALKDVRTTLEAEKEH